MIRTPNLEDRKSFGELSHKILFSLVGCDQKPLSFPDKNGSVALAFRENAFQFTSSYSEKLRSDYILLYDQVVAITLDGTPRIQRKTKYTKAPSMIIAAFIFGILGFIADDDHIVIPIIMAAFGFMLGALLPIESIENEHFWQVSIHYQMDNLTYTLRLEGKDIELKSFCAALKDHTLRDRVQDELNMIDVLSPDRSFGM
jgi:hypothetical protein